MVLREVPRIEAEELSDRMRAGEDLVVLDLRKGSYRRSDVKIAGAVRIAPNELELRYEQLPPGATVVTYCT